MNCTRFLVLAIFLFYLVLNVENITLKIIKLNGKCKPEGNSYGYFDSKIIRRNGDTYLMVSFVVTREIKYIDKFFIQSIRCPSRDDVNHCESFRNISIPYFGTLLADKHNPWGQKFQYEPPLSFPLQPGSTIRITKIQGKCNEYPHPFAYYTNIRLYEKNGITYIGLSLNVLREIKSIEKFLMMPRKCPSRDDLDHCEDYRNITIPHFSDILMDKNSIWGQKFDYKPPLTFPLKQGLYVGADQAVDTKWTVIMAKGYWRVNSRFVSDTDGVLVCSIFEGEIL